MYIDEILAKPGTQTLLQDIPLDEKNHFNFDLHRPPTNLDVLRFIRSRTKNKTSTSSVINRGVKEILAVWRNHLSNLDDADFASRSTLVSRAQTTDRMFTDYIASRSCKRKAELKIHLTCIYNPLVGRWMCGFVFEKSSFEQILYQMEKNLRGIRKSLVRVPSFHDFRSINRFDDCPSENLSDSSIADNNRYDRSLNFLASKDADDIDEYDIPEESHGDLKMSHFDQNCHLGRDRKPILKEVAMQTDMLIPLHLKLPDNIDFARLYANC